MVKNFVMNVSYIANSMKNSDVTTLLSSRRRCLKLSRYPLLHNDSHLTCTFKKMHCYWNVRSSIMLVPTESFLPSTWQHHGTKFWRFSLIFATKKSDLEKWHSPWQSTWLRYGELRLPRRCQWMAKWRLITIWTELFCYWTLTSWLNNLFTIPVGILTASVYTILCFWYNL